MLNTESNALKLLEILKLYSHYFVKYLTYLLIGNYIGSITGALNFNLLLFLLDNWELTYLAIFIPDLPINYVQKTSSLSLLLALSEYDWICLYSWHIYGTNGELFNCI
jgi:hypothetical protein